MEDSKHPIMDFFKTVLGGGNEQPRTANQDPSGAETVGFLIN